MKSLPIETSAVTPYTIKTIEGGIKIPREPAVAIVPTAYFLGYPACIIAPNIIDPIATTVAGDEPDTAANIIDAKIADIGSPPGKCPTIDFANSIIL